ncbi:MAG: hypothetical protein FWB80_05710 [Defluviitaleaceae bacterium]|nr:hypothetical protein [Defluviitaleaceae bacterium]
MILLWILFWIFAVLIGLILLVILLLAVPVRYAVTATHDNATNYTIRATYLFKIVRFYYENIDGVENSRFYIVFFRISSKKKDSKPKSKTEKTEKKEELPVDSPKKESITKKITNAYEVLTDGQGKTIIKQVVGTLKKVARSLLPEYVNVNGSVGLACPFKTGLLFGAYETIAGMFPSIKEKVTLTGDFNSDDVVFRLNATVRGKINALRIILPILFMVIKKPMRTFLLDLW